MALGEQVQEMMQKAKPTSSHNVGITGLLVGIILIVIAVASKSNPLVAYFCGSISGISFAGGFGALLYPHFRNTKSFIQQKGLTPAKTDSHDNEVVTPLLTEKSQPVTLIKWQKDYKSTSVSQHASTKFTTTQTDTSNSNDKEEDEFVNKVVISKV